MSQTPIPAMSAEISKLKYELEWYKAYADNVQATNHGTHEYACQQADEMTGNVVDYPYAEGDDYWTIEETDEEYDDNTGCYSDGIIAVQSCWDDQSEEFHRENPYREYFNSLEEILEEVRDEKDFIKVSCFDSGYPDIKTGDYFVADEETGKFKKS